MGNCQTSEAATILIERPDNRTDRLYFSVTAQEVMSSNPGHYLALVVTPPTTSFNKNDGEVKKQLKLLRPSDSLLIGHVYRLISFEDVLKEFNGRKCVKMGKLLKENGTDGSPAKQDSGAAGHFSLREGEDVEEGTSDESNERSYSMNMGIASTRMNRQQWRPALQSISEIGS